MEMLQRLRGGLIVLIALLSLLPVWLIQAEPNPVNINALWVSESEGVLKVRTADGTLLFEIPFASDIRGIAVDQQRGVLWAASHTSLRAYQFDGTLLRSSPLQDPNILFNAGIGVKINPVDGHVWITRDHNVIHFDAEANHLA